MFRILIMIFHLNFSLDNVFNILKKYIVIGMV